MTEQEQAELAKAQCTIADLQLVRELIGELEFNRNIHRVTMAQREQERAERIYKIRKQELEGKLKKIAA